MTSRDVSGALSTLQAIFDHGPLVEVTGTAHTIGRYRRGQRIELAQPTPDGSLTASINIWCPPAVTWPPTASAGSTVTIRGRWAIRRTTNPASIELTAIAVTVHDTPTGPVAAATNDTITPQGAVITTPVRVVGLICARTGIAGRTDYVGRLHQLAPHIRFDTRPATLAGPGAVTAIINSLRALDTPRTDLIAIIRGGGAPSDLATFNSRTLATAIAATTTPVLIAVGHSTDHHLADDIAAYSAPTPTAAAHLTSELG